MFHPPTLLRLISGNSEDTDPISCDSPKRSDPWFPYPSKLMFLLDTIDNLPRLRISSSFMRVLLWLLGEVGVQNVPSFDGLKKVQKWIQAEGVVPTIHWKSPKGNTFSFNNPCAIVTNVRHISKPLSPKLTSIFHLGLGKPHRRKAYMALSSYSKGWSHF